ncbi:hypothetical protein T4D_7088 [Trichinella pseudospiralis]|uniref:Uncharacterized protein n=1 Tax=Trichinella pseudospiralis TaxID=6337 RepID=A0A0V1FBY8_TRIPS|nr:hypothetical protein T4D_7088 [Trichinella pseudospiralis]
MSGYSLFSSATIVDKQKSRYKKILITKQVDFIRSSMANLYLIHCNCWQLIDKPLVRTNYRNEAHELLKAVFAQMYNRIYHRRHHSFYVKILATVY